MNCGPKNLRALTLYLIALTFIFACGFPATPVPTSNPLADPNAFNTAVAQTAAAQRSDPSAFNTAIAQTAAAATPLAFGGGDTAAAPTAIPPTSVQPAPVQPAQTSGDEQEIRKALLEKLGWDDIQMEFTLKVVDGRVAYGTVRQIGQAGGAGWFAAKDNGQWVILQVGQGWPPCKAIEPYNIPLSDLPSCEDDAGMAVDRAAPPAGATPATADFYPPDPLGPAWSAMWFEHGACYDMDLLYPSSDSACDINLDANDIFTPQNGALFDAAPYQSAPSMNTCNAAALTADPIDARKVTYVCFKTNAGKYGFFIPREIQSGGIVFDAYIFP